MPLYLTEKQTAMWAYSRSRSLQTNLKIGLARMACLRQAAMDRTTLEAFTQALVLEDDQRAVQVALATISETKREEGQTAFPDLGTILAVVKKAQESYCRSLRDPPADREPVYALEAGAPPPRLTGDRLALAVKEEIEVIRRQFQKDQPLPEAQRLRFEQLREMENDYRAYEKKRLAATQQQSLPSNAGGVL